MRLLLLLLVACLPFLSAAQGTLATHLPTVQVAAAPDTMAALHRLFAAKRKKLRFILLGTVATEIASQVIVSSTVQSGGIIDDRAISRLFVTVLVVPIVLAEALFFSQYNEKHELQAIDRYQVHQLSPHLKRQLKTRYFR